MQRACNLVGSKQVFVLQSHHRELKFFNVGMWCPGCPLNVWKPQPDTCQFIGGGYAGRECIDLNALAHNTIPLSRARLKSC